MVPPWPDRNTRINIFDRVTGEWWWIEPDYMSSGGALLPFKPGCVFCAPGRRCQPEGADCPVGGYKPRPSKSGV